MRATQWHVDNATKEQILAEYARIKTKTSTMSRKFRDAITERAQRSFQQA